MLGHVAQSIGGALPGIGSAESALVGQALLQTRGTTNTIVPEGAAFAFIELLSQGGAPESVNGNFAGGAGGEDKIIAVAPGRTFSTVLNYTNQSAMNSTMSYDGALVMTSQSGGYSSNSNGSGGGGKYPGQRGGAGGKGGGRLAGEIRGSSGGPDEVRPGYGGGARGISNYNSYGGLPVACITFFRNREAAVAFANSLYNGAWVPS